MTDSFDVIIIGAGPGGYVCAIRAAQLGLSVAIIEKRCADGAKKATFGGTCLNVGCIPSKALLDSSEHYHNAVHSFANHGIVLNGKPSIDVSTMLKRKQSIVGNLTGGIDYLLKKNKVTTYTGMGRLANDHQVIVTALDGSEQALNGKNIVLAMGSVPVELPFMPFDDKNVVSSTEALCFEEVPKSLVVVGGGVIGLELGSVWARLGSKVTVIEFLSTIATGYEADVCKALQKSLESLGITFHLSTKVTGATSKKNKTTVSAENKAGEKVEFVADKVLVAVGRRPLSENAAIELAGVKIDERKRIIVNEKMQTSCPHIYAIGDLIAGPMLAHKAEEEGVAVAENIAGKHGHVDLNLVPKVVYTWPELASVGKDITELKAEGRGIRTGTFHFKANGRAQASGDVDGFVRVIADEKTDELLGVTILGPRASDLIAEAGLVMAFGGSAEDIALVCHAHPTFSEAVKEAALDSMGRVIHS